MCGNRNYCRNRDGKSSSWLSGKALDADKGYRGNKLISSACSGKHSYMLCCRAVCLCDARDLGVCVCVCVCLCVCVCIVWVCVCVCVVWVCIVCVSVKNPPMNHERRQQNPSLSPSFILKHIQQIISRNSFVVMLKHLWFTQTLC